MSPITHSTELEPFLKPFLTDPQITDLCIGPSGAFLDRGQGLEKVESSESRFSESRLKDWVIQQLAQQGRNWDARHPFADWVFPLLTSGQTLRIRGHAIFPPVSGEGTQISLRRLSTRESTSSSRWQTPSNPAYDLLRGAVLRKETLLIVGATGSGKTTLLRDLIGEIPPSERLVALEDTPELHPDHPHFVRLVSRPPNADGSGEVTLRTLFRQTLRMRPDRILIGECRGGEVLEWLQALNAGHAGALATLHATSIREALRRAELLALLAGVSGLSAPVVRELLASGIQWIARVARTPHGRSITEIGRVRGREGDTILIEAMINPGHEGANERPEAISRPPLGPFPQAARATRGNPFLD
jgi:pilus assembly protein CpaF